MSKKAPNKNGKELADHQLMKLDYFQPDTTLREIAKKYGISLTSVYNLAKKHNWYKEKKTVNEIAFLECVAAFIKKRKDNLLTDLDRIEGITEKVFKRLKNINPADIKVSDLTALIKCKYDILAKFGTNKPINENTINEGDTTFNFNISDSDLDIKIANLTKDLTKNNRVKALETNKK